MTSAKHDVPVSARCARAGSGSASTVQDVLLRTLFAEAPDGIVMTDRDARCVAVNARFCELVERSRAELLGTSLVDLLVADDAERLPSARRLFAGRQSIESGEWRLRLGDGGERAVEINARTLSSGHCLAFVRDVSARRSAERARERTARENEAELRRAVKSRDEVLRVVSHDLRDPLQCVALAAQQLGEGIEPGLEPLVLRAAVDRIQRASRSMARLVEDLLDIASIEAGRLAVQPTTLRADTFLHEVLDVYHGQAQVRGIALAVGVATTSTIVADPGRLLQALSNIVGNALKFTPPGGSVWVRAEDDGDAVRISIDDSGPGIPREHAARVFEPFWQIRHADRRGRGLGLAIAKGIVEAHGGRIWLESEPGRGTTVAFTVPRPPLT